MRNALEKGITADQVRFGPPPSFLLVLSLSTHPIDVFADLSTIRLWVFLDHQLPHSPRSSSDAQECASNDEDQSRGGQTKLTRLYLRRIHCYR